MPVLIDKQTKHPLEEAYKTRVDTFLEGVQKIVTNGEGHIKEVFPGDVIHKLKGRKAVEPLNKYLQKIMDGAPSLLKNKTGKLEI